MQAYDWLSHCQFNFTEIASIPMMHAMRQLAHVEIANYFLHHISLISSEEQQLQAPRNDELEFSVILYLLRGPLTS